MFKKIKIKNFQSHRDTVISLSPGINGLIGSSLSGKTAILRSVKLLAKNRPLGTNFHSDFAKKNDPTKIESVLYDGTEIALNKGRGEELFYSIKTDKGTKKFRKFGTKIPDIIENKLNLKDINFQEQLDSHFVITSPGGQIAKEIGKITKADKIIEWTKKIAKELSTLKITQKVFRTEIREINQKLFALKGISKFEAVLSKIEKLQEKQKENEEEYLNLTSLQRKIKGHQKAISGRKKYETIKCLILKIEHLDGALKAVEAEKDTILKTQKLQYNLKQIKAQRENTIEKYIAEIQCSKQCPTCFQDITRKVIFQIKREVKK